MVKKGLLILFIKPLLNRLRIIKKIEARPGRPGGRREAEKVRNKFLRKDLSGKSLEMKRLGANLMQELLPLHKKVGRAEMT